MLCAQALVRALNDAKNRAQQGCAMQFSGITLTKQKQKGFIDTIFFSSSSTNPVWKLKVSNRIFFEFHCPVVQSTLIDFDGSQEVN